MTLGGVLAAIGVRIDRKKRLCAKRAAPEAIADRVPEPADGLTPSMVNFILMADDDDWLEWPS